MDVDNPNTLRESHTAACAIPGRPRWALAAAIAIATLVIFAAFGMWRPAAPLRRAPCGR